MESESPASYHLTRREPEIARSAQTDPTSRGSLSMVMQIAVVHKCIIWYTPLEQGY